MCRTVIITTVTMVLLLFASCESNSTDGGPTFALGELAKNSSFGMTSDNITAVIRPTGGVKGSSDAYYSIDAGNAKVEASGGWSIPVNAVAAALVDYSVYTQLSFYAKLPAGTTALGKGITFKVKMESGLTDKKGAEIVVSPPATAPAPWQIALTNTWQKIRIPLSEFKAANAELDLTKISAPFLYVFNAAVPATGTDAAKIAAQKTAIAATVIHIDEISFDKVAIVKPTPQPEPVVGELGTLHKKFDVEFLNDPTATRTIVSSGGANTANTDDEYLRIVGTGTKTWAITGYLARNRASGGSLNLKTPDDSKLTFKVRLPKALPAGVTLHIKIESDNVNKEIAVPNPLTVGKWLSKELNLSQFGNVDLAKVTAPFLIVLRGTTTALKGAEVHFDDINFVKDAGLGDLERDTRFVATSDNMVTNIIATGGAAKGSSDAYYSIDAGNAKVEASGGWSIPVNAAAAALVDYGAYTQLSFYAKLPAGSTALGEGITFKVKMESGLTDKKGAEIVVSPPATAPAPAPWQIALTNTWQKIRIPLSEFKAANAELDLTKISAPFLYVFNAAVPATGTDAAKIAAQKTAIAATVIHIDEISFETTGTGGPTSGLGNVASSLSKSNFTFTPGFDDSATLSYPLGGQKGPADRYYEIKASAQRHYLVGGWNLNNKADAADVRDYSKHKNVSFYARLPKGRTTLGARLKFQIKMESWVGTKNDRGEKDPVQGAIVDLSEKLTTAWQKISISLEEFKKSNTNFDLSKISGPFIYLIVSSATKIPAQKADIADAVIHIDEINFEE